MGDLDDFTKILFGAGGTLVVGLIVGIVTWVVQARREHTKWVREKRFELYTDISDLATAIWIDPTKFGVTAEMMGKNKFDEVDSALAGYQKMHNLVSRLTFVGPSAIVPLGTALVIAADSVTGVHGSEERKESSERFNTAAVAFAKEAAKILKF